MNNIFFSIMILYGIVLAFAAIFLENFYFYKLKKYQIKWYSKITYNLVIVWLAALVLKHASPAELFPLLGVILIFSLHIYFLAIGLKNLS